MGGYDEIAGMFEFVISMRTRILQQVGAIENSLVKDGPDDIHAAVLAKVTQYANRWAPYLE
jgi:hypothetical protein